MQWVPYVEGHNSTQLSYGRPACHCHRCIIHWSIMLLETLLSNDSYQRLPERTNYVSGEGSACSHCMLDFPEKVSPNFCCNHIQLLWGNFVRIFRDRRCHVVAMCSLLIHTFNCQISAQKHFPIHFHLASRPTLLLAGPSYLPGFGASAPCDGLHAL